MSQIKINGDYLEYDVDPDHCPLCHHGIKPVHIGENVITIDDLSRSDILQIIYRCPRKKCQQAFIGSYTRSISHMTHRPDGPYTLRRTSPYYPGKPDIPDEICKLSPGYVEIYGQSFIAEAYGLDQVAGVGYRKSLEFLIKDFVVYVNPSDQEAIKESFLGNCINRYVDDARLQQCAKRAAWLGNDETHYLRKWKKRDINDLKALIRLTEAWVLNNLLTEHYLKDMEPDAQDKPA